MEFNIPVFIFRELFDHPLLGQLGQDGPVLLLRAVTDVKGVRLTQSDAGLYKPPDSGTQGLEVTLQDPGAALVLGMQLRRHCFGRVCGDEKKTRGGESVPQRSCAEGVDPT